MRHPRPVPLPVPVADVRVRVRFVGACGPYAHVVADFAPPAAPDGGLEVLSAVPEARLPGEFLPPLRAGLAAGLDGVAADVLLTDGGFHETDSSAYGFEIAGRQAGRAALVGAGLLPPEAAEELRWADWPGRPRPRRRPAGGAAPG